MTLLYWREQRSTSLLALLGRLRQVTIIGWPDEVAKGGGSADVLVVDVPRRVRRSVCEQVRGHYHGRLIVLLDPWDSHDDLPPTMTGRCSPDHLRVRSCWPR